MKRDATRYDGKVPVCFFSSAFPHLRDEEEYESTRKLTTLRSCSGHRGLVEGLKEQKRWHIRGGWGEFCSTKVCMNLKLIKWMQPQTSLCTCLLHNRTNIYEHIQGDKNKILYWQKQKKACSGVSGLISTEAKSHARSPTSGNLGCHYFPDLSIFIFSPFHPSSSPLSISSSSPLIPPPPVIISAAVRRLAVAAWDGCLHYSSFGAEEGWTAMSFNWISLLCSALSGRHARSMWASVCDKGQAVCTRAFACMSRYVYVCVWSHDEEQQPDINAFTDMMKRDFLHAESSPSVPETSSQTRDV